jgi:hypothetical protein
MSNLTKKELYAYAFKKAGEVNNSDEEKYLHKNIYKAFVCPPIENGIATTYEDVDKLIEEYTTNDPKTTEDYMYEQLDIEMKQKENELIEWCATLNDDEVKTIHKIIDMVGEDYYGEYRTLKTILNNKNK